MRKPLLFLLLFSCIITSSFAGDGEYSIAKISSTILEKVDAVKRMEEMRFELIDIGKAKLYHKYAITVFNENGDDFVGMMLYYDKFRSIESVEGTLYDANGKKLRSLKKSDIKDIGAIGGADDIGEARYKLHSFYCKTYPYTVEYEIEEKYNNTLFYPNWDPVEGDRFAVEESKVSIVCPKDYVLRYRTFNYTENAQIVEDGSRKTYTWEVKNLPGIVEENFAPVWKDLVPNVLFGPSEFKIGDYSGNMSSWKEFGKFVYSLKKDRDDLPDNIKLKVHQLADGLKEDREKVKVLYEMMQNSTRYVSIQLGIGGWQPLDAKYVASKGYGDCKALSNYMFSLLKEAGIKSCYTLALAGSRGKYFVSDFPSQQFNHVILCVPMQKDTMWLECTSQTLQAGYLSEFTSDRYVLLIDENGGTLVKTPKYGLNENRSLRIVSGNIDSMGTLSANINTSYSGILQDNIFSRIHTLSKEKQMEFLKSHIDLPQYDITNFEYKEKDERIPVIDEKLELNAVNYAAITGKRLFVSPNIVSRLNWKINPNEKRKYPIVFRLEYAETDSAELTIPDGYKSESIPADLKVESKFGKYTASVKAQGNKILYYRKFERFSGEFPVSDFPDIVKFYDQIYKADHSKIVLVKN